MPILGIIYAVIIVIVVVVGLQRTCQVFTRVIAFQAELANDLLNDATVSEHDDEKRQEERDRRDEELIAKERDLVEIVRLIARIVSEV